MKNSSGMLILGLCAFGVSCIFLISKPSALNGDKAVSREVAKNQPKSAKLTPTFEIIGEKISIAIVNKSSEDFLIRISSIAYSAELTDGEGLSFEIVGGGGGQSSELGQIALVHKPYAPGPVLTADQVFYISFPWTPTLDKIKTMDIMVEALTLSEVRQIKDGAELQAAFSRNHTAYPVAPTNKQDR